MLTSKIAVRRLWRGTIAAVAPVLVVASLTAASPADLESQAASQDAGLLAQCQGSGSVLGYGNWECGTPNAWSPWNNLVRASGAESYAFQRNTSNVRTGTFSARFEVRPGDTPPNTGGSGERIEVSNLPGGNIGQGDDRWYAFSVFFPSSWTQCGGAGQWCIFAQWHFGGTGGKTLALYAPRGNIGGGSDRILLEQLAGDCTTDTTGNCEVSNNHTVMSGNVFRNNLGTWIDFIVRVKWSINNDGVVRVWTRIGNGDRSKVVDYSGPTLRRNEGNIRTGNPTRFGLYRGDESINRVLLNDSYCIATNFDAAASCLPAGG